jgi:hypothetical protein
MKNLTLLLIISGCFLIFSCVKESKSETFKLLTGPVWASDSLLVNGVDAGYAGGMLDIFKGDAKFNTDGTGYFGKYSGNWRFAYNETEIIIVQDSLLLPITTKIAELTAISLKITTTYPNTINPASPFFIRMTFKAK